MGFVSCVNIDVVDMYLTSSGYQYIVNVRDDLTGWIEARMPKTKCADTACKVHFSSMGTCGDTPDKTSLIHPFNMLGKYW